MGVFYSSLGLILFLRERLQVGKKCPLDPAQKAPLERRHADGAGSAIVCERDKRAVRSLFLRHLRDNGYSEARADHGENTAELSALKDHVRRHPRAFAGFHGGLAKTVVFAQQEKRLVAQ